MPRLVTLCVCLLTATASRAADLVVWQEAESMASTGTWSNDPQHMDIMGSPYLLATGLGKPVRDAVCTVAVPAGGAYTLWVRCRDWLPSHSPGRFEVLVNGQASPVTFGKAEHDRWHWVNGGRFELDKGRAELRLRDVTGWWGRCDTIVLAAGEFTPADEPKALAAQRLRYAGVSPDIQEMEKADVVVVGGGPAGIGAALAAARRGLRVAFIQDRPVLGGNSSSEIQVPPMGYIGSPPDRLNVGGIAAEIFPPQGWHNFADSAKIEQIVRREKNITLLLNTRGVGVEMAAKDRIAAVIAQDVRSGRRMRLEAPLFIDTTGHGWIGYYAGADYRMGQEARSEYDESLAPLSAGTRTQGNSLYKAVIETRDKPAPFDCPAWAHQWTSTDDFEPLGSHRRSEQLVRPDNFDAPSRGKGRNPGNDVNGAILYAWWVEYGGMLNIIQDAERIRDELLRISLGLWNYAKNHNPATRDKNANRELVWLNYVPGVRESRRLLGDYVMSQQDYDWRTVHDDTVAFTDWGPDVHHPEGFWVQGNDCIHVYKGRRTSIPYRTLYSRNIVNLFMAGRCHSATHIAMGGTRVMRPMCATGQAAGTAAAIAVQHKTTPRGVYEKHIRELQDALVADGCRLMKPDGTMREPAGAVGPQPKGIVMDDSKAELAGQWKAGIYNPLVGPGYIHDDNRDKGKKSARFAITVPRAGSYHVVLLYPPGENRATNTPVTVRVDGDTSEHVVNQRTARDGGRRLGTFAVKKSIEVTVSNTGTDGYVIVDGVQVLEDGHSK